jgi:tetratricopeptide (TPR) repeat protein/tRNA A-37 threonylcarbamoyl transferase component Bud32
MCSVKDHDRWRRIEAIFEQALSLSAKERSELFARECGDDLALRAEVERLLRADAQAGEFLDTPVVKVGEALGGDGWTGRTVGAYRLVRCIGEGGMATVYLAIRADDEYQKRVAVKLLRGGLEGPEAEHRLRRERQILAGLEHPNIARLLDGGTTPQGAPYLVMEHIEGEPIDDYCEHHDLGISERIALFVQVLGAVQYAHHNLVVHRDLKPSNILVTQDGVPKLLDFGIAKLLNPELGGQIDPTRADLLLLTPSYASPEQITGRAVTTASDVYSLGVVLYHLLTRTSPYGIDTGNMDGIVRAVCEVNPTRPSRALEQRGERAQSRRLRGDLDHIVLKALEKEPHRRYQSAEQLGEDLRRFDQGLPVSARSAGALYLAGKFLRRHRWGVVAALLLVAGLSWVAVHTAVQSARTARALKVAERERSKAEAINDFLVEMLVSANPAKGGGRDVTVIEAMEQATSSIAQSLADQPEVEASVRLLIGMTYRELGRLEEAESMLSSALAIRRRVLGKHPDVAETLNTLGRTLQKLGRSDEAEQCHREALAINRELLGPDHHDTLSSLLNLALILRYRDQLDEVEQLLREVLAAFERKTDASLEDVATVRNNLGTALMDKGDFRGAAATLKQALAEADTAFSSGHPKRGLVLATLAMARCNLGELDTAETMMRQSIAIYEQAFGEEHALVGYDRYGLGMILEAGGDAAQAEEEYRAGLAILRMSPGATDAQVAKVLRALAYLLSNRGEWQAATSLLDEAEVIVVRTSGPDSAEHATTLQVRGWIGLGSGNLDAADAAARHSLEIRTRIFGEESYACAASLTLKASVLAALGRDDEAFVAFTKAIATLEQLGDPSPRTLIECRTRYGLELATVGRSDEAERQLRSALGSFTRSPRLDPALRTRILDALVELYEALGKEDRLADCRAQRGS